MEPCLRSDRAIDKCDLSTVSCLHGFPKRLSLVWNAWNADEEIRKISPILWYAACVFFNTFFLGRESRNGWAHDIVGSIYPHFYSLNPVWRRYSVYIYIYITCSHPSNRPESKPWSNALQRSHLRIMIGLYPSHWVCSCKNPVFVGQISILMKQLCYEGRD